MRPVTYPWKLCLLQVASMLSACSSSPSGPDITADERAGCEVQCRLVFECAEKNPEAQKTCVNACGQALESASAACREQTALAGECSKDRSCEELELGTCAELITPLEEMCKPIPHENQEAGEGSSEPDGGELEAGQDGAIDCKQFNFVASGQACPQGGCTAIVCTCEGDFPRSLTLCEKDGCIISADCDAVCAAESILDALECSEVYTIAGADGGF